MISTGFFGHVKRHAIGYLALMVALGGTAYAATELPRSSVDTAQLKRGAVTSSKVERKSLARSAFRAGALPAATHVVRFRPVPAGPGGQEPINRSFVAECERGERATGGGFEISDDRAFALASHPFPGEHGAKPTGWRVVVHDPTPGLIGWSVYAVCASR